MNKRKFYEEHGNFSRRTISEYYLSPGIQCKFNLIIKQLGSKHFSSGIDLGCSGNSILQILKNVKHKSFYDLAKLPLSQYTFKKRWNPISGDIVQLPFRDESFDILTALDVLEHVKDDDLAIAEISRITEQDGIVVITVPHREKYYTNQDHLIGHFRRYEINDLIKIFEENNLFTLKIFGVYGQLMRIADIQSSNPEKMEENIQKLRDRYNSNLIFRRFWKYTVKITAKVMELDARYQSLDKIMNIGLFLKKKSP